MWPQEGVLRGSAAAARGIHQEAIKGFCLCARRASILTSKLVLKIYSDNEQERKKNRFFC
jgi:hypothetical protein